MNLCTRVPPHPQLLHADKLLLSAKRLQNYETIVKKVVSESFIEYFLIYYSISKLHFALACFTLSNQFWTMLQELCTTISGKKQSLEALLVVFECDSDRPEDRVALATGRERRSLKVLSCWLTIWLVQRLSSAILTKKKPDASLCCHTLLFIPNPGLQQYWW